MWKIKKFIFSLFKKSIKPDKLGLTCCIEDNGDVNRYVDYCFTCPVCGKHGVWIKADIAYYCCGRCGFSVPIDYKSTEYRLYPIANFQFVLNRLISKCFELKRKHKNKKNIELELDELIGYNGFATKYNLQEQIWRK